MKPPSDGAPSLDRLDRRRAWHRRRVDDALEQWLPDPREPPQRLHEAMRYAVLGGGKRVRATLVYAAAEAAGAGLEGADPPACAVELIHAYSLVHDDLPAMDDDDFRRGRPSCHRAFDEATALLAGDALQTLAFEVLSSDGESDGVCRAPLPHAGDTFTRVRVARHGGRSGGRPRFGWKSTRPG